MIQFEQAGSVPAISQPAEVSLTVLLDRAASALVAAKSSAEVLDARDMARVAYDAAKSAGRLARAKQAHDTVLAEVYRAQAGALMIEARTKIRLAEEYDAAQDRGEVAGPTGNNLRSEAERKPTAADVGLTRKDVHEARQIRDAELANPGVTERVLTQIIDSGEEPTKAKLNREIFNRTQAAPQKVMDQSALWLWGRFKDFERDGVLSKEPEFLISEMTEPMRADVKRISPLVRAFLEKMEQFA